MDATPEKKHTRPSSLSKFEDSPVFNFINSLSPIKPVKSIHTAQTFNSISFPAIPSVFTSPPHIISPHKEFKSPRRPNLSNPSKSASPFKDGTAVSTNEGAVMILDRLLEIFVPDVSLGDDISKVSNPTIKAPENVNGQSSENVPLGDEEDRNCQTDKEGAAPEWESSMGDAGELLLLSTCPISAEAMEAFQKGAGFVNPNEADGEPWLLHRGGSEAKVKNMQGKKEEDDEGYANSNEFMGMNTVDTRDDKMDNCLSFENKALSNLQRGMRRRCLDFEMAGTLRKTAPADDGPNQVSASSSASTNAFRCTLPGIGLHLNALAATLKRCNQHSDSENLSSETDLTLPISYAPPFYAANSTQQQLLLPSTTPEQESLFQENPNRIAEDPNQTNPKKNRKWVENSGVGACKRCNCKKSRCLKLYCECFAAGVYCIEPCSCQDCYNKPIHEGIVLETRRQIESRNPLAFAPKVILNSDSASELGDDSNKTPASARHKRGCNCKKSGCLKKYCECYQGGVGCSINCRCEGCKNAFGRKDDSALIAIETEQEEEERELCQKSTETQNDEDQQNPSNDAPLTPVGPCRSLIPLPFPLKRKLPSSFIDERSSSRLSVRYKFEKQSIIQTDPKFEKSTCEDEMPETLCTGCSTSSTGVKSVSPNSKRVTLPRPRGDFGQSPSARIGRKLILQSVPSFPSLTNQNSRVNGPSKL